VDDIYGQDDVQAIFSKRLKPREAQVPNTTTEGKDASRGEGSSQTKKKENNNNNNKKKKKKNKKKKKKMAEFQSPTSTTSVKGAGSEVSTEFSTPLKAVAP